MTIEGRPVLSDKTYKKYVLEHLENWVHDAITTDEVTAQEVYDVIIKCIEINVEHHKDNLDKNVELLSLLKGNRNIDLNPDGKDWHDFWESYQEPSCDAAEDKEKCREYNLREAEYYTKRAELDAEDDRKKQCTCDY